MNNQENLPYFLHDDPSISPAYFPFYTHEYINYFTVLTQSWVLNRPKISIQPNPSFNDWPIGPNHKDIFKESFQMKPETEELDEYDSYIRKGEFSVEIPKGVQTEPWRSMVFYCTEPDWAIDCDLELHWKQSITKGSHGYRHMEFRLFGIKFGITTQAVKYYLEAAKRAFKSGNEYWTWRFLARCSHYLADLGHPFHVKVISSQDILQLFLHPKQAFKNMTAAHNAHEVYTENRFRTGFTPFKSALIEGSKVGAKLQISLFDEIRQMQKSAAKQFTPLYRALIGSYGEKLVNVYQVKQSSGVDLSKQTMTCEKAAKQVLFADLNNPALKILDDITTELLFKVGKIIGVFYTTIKKEIFNQ